MELHKLTSADLKGLDVTKLRETENDLRKQLVDIRMDVYAAKAASAAKVKGLRRSLARLLTFGNDLARKNPAPAKVKAPAKAATPKSPKAVKPAKRADKAAAEAKPAKAKAAKPVAAKAKIKTETKK